MWKIDFLSFQISSFSDLDIDLTILNVLFDIATAIKALLVMLEPITIL